MLAPITSSTNRLMRLYERLGFIPMGDNEVVLVTNPMFNKFNSSGEKRDIYELRRG